MLKNSNLKKFYDEHPFPGPYTQAQLEAYGAVPCNRYLAQMNRYLDHGQTVLDVGCGTGLVTNLFASRYRSEFVAVDFSSGIDYARQFAKENNINNVQFVKQDFFKYVPNQKFDVVICQSFITHIADCSAAMNKINAILQPGSILLLGVYNTWGRWAKTVWPAGGSDRLQLDQYHCPFEVGYSHRQVLGLCGNLEMLSVVPSVHNHLVSFSSLFNRTNGGLALYAFRKNV